MNRGNIPRLLFLRVIEISRCFKIFSSVRKDDDLLQRRRRCLSCSTLRNSAAPESAFALRAARTSPCHSGDSISSGLSESEAQSHSIASRRSALLRRETSFFNSATLTGCKYSSRDRHAQERLWRRCYRFAADPFDRLRAGCSAATTLRGFNPSYIRRNRDGG